jgi:hypothetical protein
VTLECCGKLGWSNPADEICPIFFAEMFHFQPFTNIASRQERESLRRSLFISSNVSYAHVYLAQGSRTQAILDLHSPVRFTDSVSMGRQAVEGYRGQKIFQEERTFPTITNGAQ